MIRDLQFSWTIEKRLRQAARHLDASRDDVIRLAITKAMAGYDEHAHPDQYRNLLQPIVITSPRLYKPASEISVGEIPRGLSVEDVCMTAPMLAELCADWYGNPETLRLIIRSAEEVLHLSDSGLSKLVGIPKRTLASYASGKSVPGVETQRHIVRTIGARATLLD